MDPNNGNEGWDWQGGEYCLEDISDCLWSGLSHSDDDLSMIFDVEATPVRACGDLAYNVNTGTGKEIEQCTEPSPQAKRRRMLSFDPEVSNITLCSESMPSSNSSAKWTEDSVDEALSQTSQWDSIHPGLDHSTDGWIANCFNDAEMQFPPEDMINSEASAIQVDVTENCNTRRFGTNLAQERQAHPTRTCRNIVFKGKKSYMRAPPKLASSVVYPFAFIKPCGYHGDVTLKDINQRIRTPPPSKLKQSDADPVPFPTSAFSGKPIVGKTKIRSEGGKGSITIMRTKG